MDKDLIVIGGGPGGYVAAIRAAQLGAKVTLIEQDRLGGTCLNKGCIPTKALYKSAQMVNELSRSEDLGIKLEGFTVDLARMMTRKQEIVEKLVGGISQLLKANGVEVVKGRGRLVDSHTVEVEKSDGLIDALKARNILIASGSKPAKPPIPGIELPGVMTSDELLNIEKLPKKLLIIGGGVIGIEFACIFSAFGVEVTVVEFLPQILPTMDGDISKRMALAIKKRGISIETEVRVKEIQSSGDELTVYGEGKKGEVRITADLVLISTGRAAHLDGLDLDKLGIQYDKKGIKVDENFRTSVPNIYAIGDVIGGQMLAHVASDEGKAAVENMMGLKGHMNYDAVPGCVFAFPEVASVGMTEEELKNQGIKYIASKFMFGANGKAMTMGEEEGFVKVLAAEETKALLGVHIMGPHASDLIHEAALAVENRLTASEIYKAVHAHPTLSEAFVEAVMGLEGKAVHMAPARIKR